MMTSMYQVPEHGRVHTGIEYVIETPSVPGEANDEI